MERELRAQSGWKGDHRKGNLRGVCGGGGEGER